MVGKGLTKGVQYIFDYYLYNEVCCFDTCYLLIRPYLLHIPRSIMRACNTLGQLDQNVSNAVKCRQELDLRIGEMSRLSPQIELLHKFPCVPQGVRSLASRRDV